MHPLLRPLRRGHRRSRCVRQRQPPAVRPESGSALSEASAAEYVAGPGNWNWAARGVTFEFTNLEKLDILVTLRCNAACAHCITRSHPRRTETLAEHEILELLDAGADAGKRYTSFTGGEPFLDFPLLLRAIAFAKRRGYYVAADTNAFWGVTERRADEWVARLMDAGLDALFPSADPYHLPFVSLERVQRVIEASDRAGLACEVNFAPGPDVEVNEHIITTLALADRGYYSDGLSLTGNDVTAFLHLFPHFTVSDLDDVGSMHVGVSPLGSVFANVDISDTGAEYAGTPLALGNLREQPVATIFAAERERPILVVARTRGPASVAERLRELLPPTSALEALLGGRYYSATEFWLELFRSSEAAAFVAALEDWGRELRAAGVE